MLNETPGQPGHNKQFIGDPEVRRTIESLCDGPPDAIYLLSGVSMTRDKQTGRIGYKPGSYADVDWKGNMTGGKARALATVELAECFPDAVVVANSNTFNIHDPSAPTDAEVMADYIERQGIPAERIIQQDLSTTTFTELIELIKLTVQYRWKHAVVVAGETQKPRAEEMFRQIADLRDPDGAWQDPIFRAALEEIKTLNPEITFVSSEDILPLRDRRYAPLIVAARETETWKKRAELDKKALEDLRTGRYWKN